MVVKKGNIIELRIDEIAYGGKGIGRIDNFVVFVKGGVPGDLLRVQVFKKKKGYAEAGIVEIIESSPERVAPPCPYSGFCGGCQWQQIRYDAQLKFKQELVRQSLEHIGKVSGFPIHSTIPSDNKFAYRNKMEFSFSDRRWLLPEELGIDGIDNSFALGLHVPGTFHKVIDIDECLLQSDVGNQILKEVKNYVKKSHIPVYGLKSHEGFWRFLMLRYSNAEDQWMINLVTSDVMKSVIDPLAEMLLDKFHNIGTILNNINRRKASIAIGESEMIISGSGVIHDKLGPFKFQISANSFFQTNSSGAFRLYEKVLEYADLKGTERVLDLYSGTGTIPIFLSPHADEILGMEIVESAIKDAETNCRINNVQNCRFILGDIRDNIISLRHKPDVIIIDPPRTGMHKDVLKQVLNIKAEKIVYISCNPTTLARDIEQLVNFYDIIEVQPVDMFPHTYHIEAVAKLILRK